MKSPRKAPPASPSSRKAAKTDNLVDPALKKTFIEMAEHWHGLNERAKSAAGKRRQYEGEIKDAGYSMMQVKIRHLLKTPEGEAEFKAEMANRLLAAAYSDSDIGDQLSLFLDTPRTPAVDRAFKEGQTAAMKNEAAVPKYDPATDQYKAFMEGYHEEQARQVKSGIGKLEAKEAAVPAKKGNGAAAKPPGKRGRPAGSGKPKPAPAKGAKPKADKPDKPRAQPVTRASLKEPESETDTFFTKSTVTAGNA